VATEVAVSPAATRVGAANGGRPGAATRLRSPIALGVVALALAFLPLLGLPAFYDSFLYVVFYWISLATSWALLSGFAGYFSLGHAAYVGAGMYTSATLAAKFGWPFLLTVPVAALIAASLGTAIGLLVFRLPRLRGELFALMTLAVTFIVATIILNTPIDGGSGVFLSAVPPPRLIESQSGSIYLLGLIMCAATLGIAWAVSHSRLGTGLYAIHDDEDVAQAKGVPTFRYKLIAIALSSGIAGAVGGIHSIYVGFLTVGETFNIGVPLSVILMSVLGGARHWLGPAIGATVITVLLFGLASSGETILGRAAVALILVAAVLWLPEGVMASLAERRRRKALSAAAGSSEGTPGATPDKPPASDPANGPTADSATGPSTKVVPADAPIVLAIRDVHKRFGGVHALRGATLDIRQGEILGLIGPNGCGKTTLINMITGQLPLTSGTILLDGRPISGLPPYRIVRSGIARTYQIPRPFSHMTVLRNVALCAQFGGVGDGEGGRRDGEVHGDVDEQALHWLGFCGLAHRAGNLPGEINLRERKVLELARALAARPRVLLLDEVMSGLNPAEVDTAIRLVRRIRDQGTTIVFVEHLMRAVVQLSDRVAVMHEGSVLTVGDPQEVMRDPRVAAIYFGHRRAA
jgi:branched-chain amino acid transport system permease protein